MSSEDLYREFHERHPRDPKSGQFQAGDVVRIKSTGEVMKVEVIDPKRGRVWFSEPGEAVNWNTDTYIDVHSRRLASWLERHPRLALALFWLAGKGSK